MAILYMQYFAYAFISMHIRISIHIMHRVMHRLVSKFQPNLSVIHKWTYRICTISPCFGMQNLIKTLLRFYGGFVPAPMTMQSVYIHSFTGTYTAYACDK